MKVKNLLFLLFLICTHLTQAADHAIIIHDEDIFIQNKRKIIRTLSEQYKNMHQLLRIIADIIHEAQSDQAMSDTIQENIQTQLEHITYEICMPEKDILPQEQDFFSLRCETIKKQLLSVCNITIESPHITTPSFFMNITLHIAAYILALFVVLLAHDPFIMSNDEQITLYILEKCNSIFEHAKEKKILSENPLQNEAYILASNNAVNNNENEDKSNKTCCHII